MLSIYTVDGAKVRKLAFLACPPHIVAFQHLPLSHVLSPSPSVQPDVRETQQDMLRAPEVGVSAHGGRLTTTKYLPLVIALVLTLGP